MTPAERREAMALQHARSYYSGMTPPAPWAVRISDADMAITTDGHLLVGVPIAALGDGELPPPPDKIGTAVPQWFSLPVKRDYQLESAALAAFARVGDDASQACERCGGKRRVTCEECDGAGETECECMSCGHEHDVSCEECDGYGQMSCPDCEVRDPAKQPGALCGLVVNRTALRSALALVDPTGVVTAEVRTMSHGDVLLLRGAGWFAFLMPMNIAPTSDFEKPDTWARQAAVAGS